MDVTLFWPITGLRPRPWTIHLNLRCYINLVSTHFTMFLDWLKPMLSNQIMREETIKKTRMNLSVLKLFSPNALQCTTQVKKRAGQGFKGNKIETRFSNIYPADLNHSKSIYFTLTHQGRLSIPLPWGRSRSISPALSETQFPSSKQDKWEEWDEAGYGQTALS